MHAPLELNQVGPMRGDAFELLPALPEGCATIAVLDWQHASTLDRLKYGNPGARQQGRHALPSTSDEDIRRGEREIARILKSSGYALLWADAFRMCQAAHLHVADVLPPVALIAWNSERMGMGYRVREQGDYLLVLQKPPLLAKATWRDHGIPSRWAEKVDRKIHPHIKPAGLLRRLIAATTEPNDLIVDPCAGSFTAMHIAHELGRRFVGCDIAYGMATADEPAVPMVLT